MGSVPEAGWITVFVVIVGLSTLVRLTTGTGFSVVRDKLVTEAKVRAARIGADSY